MADRGWCQESRGGGPSWNFGFRASPACSWLLGLTVAVYVLQLLFTRQAVPADFAGPGTDPDELLQNLAMLPRISILEYWLQLTPDAVLQGQLWRLVSYGFCHSRQDVLHILFNMLFLWWFGQRLEARLGAAEFTRFYLGAIAVAGLTFLGLGLALGNPAAVIGASGGIMAVLMLFAMLYPHEQILLFLVIPVRILWLVGFYVIYDLHPLLLALGGDDPGTGVAFAAHLGGLVFGFLYWRFGWRLAPSWDGLRAVFRRRVRRAPEPAEPPPDPEAIARVLAKISEQGLPSLTPEERRTLRSSYRVESKADDVL